VKQFVLPPPGADLPPAEAKRSPAPDPLAVAAADRNYRKLVQAEEREAKAPKPAAHRQAGAEPGAGEDDPPEAAAADLEPSDSEDEAEDAASPSAAGEAGPAVAEAAPSGPPRWLRTPLREGKHQHITQRLKAFEASEALREGLAAWAKRERELALSGPGGVPAMIMRHAAEPGMGAPGAVPRGLGRFALDEDILVRVVRWMLRNADASNLAGEVEARVRAGRTFRPAFSFGMYQHPKFGQRQALQARLEVGAGGRPAPLQGAPEQQLLDAHQRPGPDARRSRPAGLRVREQGLDPGQERFQGGSGLDPERPAADEPAHEGGALLSGTSSVRAFALS
jgi:hypothetical protein